MDLKWIDSLAPDEAKAALDSLDAREGLVHGDGNSKTS
jgi:hypothetical protein